MNIPTEPTIEKRTLRSAGTLQQQRVKLPWSGQDFRLLSIDGGGIRGILPAAIVAECERRFLNGASAGSYFDMIAGTSTGGIIALALSAGIPASKILDIYTTHGGDIFPSPHSKYKIIQAAKDRYHSIRNLLTTKYDRKPLIDHLNLVLEDRLYGAAQTRLVIPSFDREGEVNIFKTPHHPDYKRDWKMSMVDVALCTTAAPSFFSAYANDGTHFMDGGLWANNPVMLGVVDVLACYDIQPEQIFCLSLGCGNTSDPVTDKQLTGGIVQWRNVFDRASDLVSQNSLGQAGLLIGRNRLLRMDTVFAHKAIKLDEYSVALNQLPQIAISLVDDYEEALAKYFNSKRTPYEACLGPRSSY